MSLLFHKATKTSSCEFKSANKCCGCVPVGAGNPQCKVAIVMCRSISQDVKSRSVACKQIFDALCLFSLLISGQKSAPASKVIFYLF